MAKIFCVHGSVTGLDQKEIEPLPKNRFSWEYERLLAFQGWFKIRKFEIKIDFRPIFLFSPLGPFTLSPKSDT